MGAVVGRHSDPHTTACSRRAPPRPPDVCRRVGGRSETGSVASPAIPNRGRPATIVYRRCSDQTSVCVDDFFDSLGPSPRPDAAVVD